MWPKLIEEVLTKHWDCHRLTKSEHTWQLHVPVTHEDGDWVQVYAYIRPGEDNIKLYVTDRGNTYMRLSFNMDVDDDSLMMKCKQIASASGVVFDEGTLINAVDIRTGSISVGVMRVVSASLRILACNYWI